jgi:hypothetical protein
MHHERQRQYGTTELPPRERSHDERVRIDISVASSTIEAVQEVLSLNESISSFAADAIVNEVKRRAGRAGPASYGGYGDVKICECGRRAITRGLCQACYAHWRRTGDTIRHSRATTPMPIHPGAQGYRISVTLSPWLLEAVREVLGPDESLSAFGRTAIASEIERRRILGER